MPEDRPNNCLDCGAAITRKAKRCRACAYVVRSENEQWKHRISEAAIIRCEDQEYRRQLSERAKRQWEDGVFGTKEWKQNVAESIHMRWEQDGYREHMAKVLENRWKRQSYRKKVIQGIKEYWTQKNRDAWAEKISGSGNPNWKGGTSFDPYPPSFNSALKAIVRERDHYRCQICGESESTSAHDVHHIDYDKTHNDPSNLVTLCHVCHPFTNGDRVFWQEYFAGRTEEYSEQAIA